MGYWEVPCQFCGVSFNIARIRMKDEPRSATMGPNRIYPYVRESKFYSDEEQSRGAEVGEDSEDEDEPDPDPEDEDEPDSDPEDEDEPDPSSEDKSELDPEPCSSSTGCAMVFRPNPVGWEVEDWSLYEDDPSDDSYGYQSASDNEILEYDSEASGDDEDSDMEIDDDTVPTEKDERLFRVKGLDPPEFDTEFLSLDTPLGMPLFFPSDDGRSRVHNTEAQKKQNRFEHIAGPDCRYLQAYIGKNISFEEMRGCRTVQGILRKPPASKPRSDDFDFERGSNYFLTGVAEAMPSSGTGLDFYPVRYGASDHIDAETNFVLETSQEELRSIVLPSHPTCFELYIQATRARNDRVDLDTLARIRDQACLEFREFPVTYNEDVGNESSQVWEHTPGTEYLVANPVYVPGLRDILEAAISTDPKFTLYNSISEVRPGQRDLSSKDPFPALPLDIILIIARFLSPHELASIQLASRAFVHLPVFFFRQLVLDNMPWLYEAWSPDPKPYYWATVKADDLITEKLDRKEFDQEIEDRREAIREHDPEIYDDFVADEPEWVELLERPEWQEFRDIGPITLPRDKTNWHKVYCGINSNWSKLKGLQNRQRIWENVMQIVDAIQKARAGQDFYLKRS